MDLRTVWICARAAIVEVDVEGLFELDAPLRVVVNGEDRGETRQIETYIGDLEPAQHYDVAFMDGDACRAHALFDTKPESFTLDVRAFGAAGDGQRDDTSSIQTAILCCPADGRVLIPRGMYKVSSLFLKDGVSVELAAGAQLQAVYDREGRAYLPGTIEGAEGYGYKGTGLLPLGTWEGESAQMFTGIINGIQVKNACVYGEGCIDGQANYENWWPDHKTIRIAARPHLFFLTECENVALVGVTLRNSPSWNIHPVLSHGLEFRCLTLESPKVSPNTDGINPESCSDLVISGCLFSVGDDCIAIKSGKLQMQRVLRPPVRTMLVEHCCMHYGHGGVVLGSEAAGGVIGLHVKNCLFDHTDRGLRIKTRRGRGKDSIYDDILFEHISMVGVGTPFTVNSFYFCDVDGKSDYVQERNPLPVDERTPHVRSLTFRDIEANESRLAASYIVGLPEMPIEQVAFYNVHVTYGSHIDPEPPEMACYVEPIAKRGLIVNNAQHVILSNVVIEGQEGKEFDFDHVARVDQYSSEK